MKVILLQDVKNLGKKWRYCRNRRRLWPQLPAAAQNGKGSQRSQLKPG